MPAFVVLVTAFVFSQFFRSFLAIVASDLSRDLGFTAADLGNLSAIWFAAFAFAQFPIGAALDRAGPRLTVGVTLLAAVAGSALFAVAEGLATALAAMALIGVGCAPVLMGTMYLIGRTVAPGRLAALGSIVIGVGSLGNLIGATPLAIAAAVFGWRATFLMIAVAVAIVAGLVFALVRNPPRLGAPADAGPQPGPRSGLLDALRVPGLLPVLPIVWISYAVVIGERSLWIGPYLLGVHGLDDLARANAAFAMSLALALGAFAYSWAEKRLGGPKPTVVLGSALTAASFAGLAAVPAGSPLAATVFLAGIGFFGFTYGVLLAHGRLFFPDRLLGRGMTALNFGFIGGAALVQLGSGQIVTRLAAAGWGPHPTYAVLHGVFAALLVLSLAIYLRAPARPSAPA